MVILDFNAYGILNLSALRYKRYNRKIVDVPAFLVSPFHIDDSLSILVDAFGQLKGKA